MSGLQSGGVVNLKVRRIGVPGVIGILGDASAGEVLPEHYIAAYDGRIGGGVAHLSCRCVRVG